MSVETRITSRQNPLLQRVRRLLSSRRERETSGLFAAEGTKLLGEAVRWGADIETVLLADGVEADVPADTSLVRVPRDVMASLSTQDAPQGALFVCRMPQTPPFVPYAGMLLLDGIQDPGNLGTILRTADALEVPAVLLEGCADAYSPKTVRASMGAVFRTPVVSASFDEAARACREAQIPIAVTALCEGAADIRAAKLAEMAVAVGSEGRGVRPEVLARADAVLKIPMNPRCESLNAAIAAAIVMWRMRE